MHNILQNKIYKYIYFTINHLISSISIILYLFGIISVWTEIIIEIILLICKSTVEILYNSSTWDLKIHHISFVYALYKLFIDDPESKFAWIFVHMHLIHIPLLFYSIKKILLITKTETGVQYMENLYLITWPIITIYRCLILLFTTLNFYINNNNNKILYILIYITPSICILDYYWTPWKKYKKILN